MKADDLLGTATFTVQDILDKGGDGSNDVSLDLALKDGLVKKGSEATVSLTARFVSNSGVLWCGVGIVILVWVWCGYSLCAYTCKHKHHQLLSFHTCPVLIHMLPSLHKNNHTLTSFTHISTQTHTISTPPPHNTQRTLQHKQLQ